MWSARCVAVTQSGENNDMRHTFQQKADSIEDCLRKICRVYGGEDENPYEIDALSEDDREIQCLRYHLWDVERSIMESPAYWRFLIIENHGSIPQNSESLARRIYDYAANQKLELMKEMCIDLSETYKRIMNK